jgi:two-component system chemotaxis response regulator CheB
MSEQAAPSRLIRVLVADDSAFMRTALTRMIESESDLRVVAVAQNGREAIEQVKLLQPDVVTLDVEMPELNGLETLQRIMAECPRPVLMVSSLTLVGAETTLEALASGAFDYVPKQRSHVCLDIVKIREDLISKIRAAAESAKRKLVPRINTMSAPNISCTNFGHMPPRVVALGTSTGGPRALQQILPMLPQDLPVAVLVVQHMPPGFTAPFARRLDNLCHVSVREAAHNDVIDPGIVYIAPAGSHMTVWHSHTGKNHLRISDSPQDTLHTPSVDVMMLSVAEEFHDRCMGVIMTGMGADGLVGMQAIAREGGMTLGQNEETCTVYGMPKSCAEAGVLQRVVSLAQIPEQILQATAYRRHA